MYNLVRTRIVNNSSAGYIMIRDDSTRTLFRQDFFSPTPHPKTILGRTARVPRATTGELYVLLSHQHILDGFLRVHPYAQQQSIHLFCYFSYYWFVSLQFNVKAAKFSCMWLNKYRTFSFPPLLCTRYRPLAAAVLFPCT